jgi:4-hydroxy-3-methylbut-2-enyl diphosphate reductase IspH
MSLKNYTTEEIEAELRRRNKQVVDNICPTCRKYTVTFKQYQGWGQHLHCDGCNKRVENCTC